MRTLKRDELARRIDATGLKPYAFAKKCGIVPESLRRWLNGARVPKVENIQKMAEFLHCSVADISEWAFVLDKKALVEEEDQQLMMIRTFWRDLDIEQRESVMALLKSMAEANRRDPEFRSLMDGIESREE